MPNIEWVEAYIAFTDYKGFERWPNPDRISESVLEDVTLYMKKDLPSEYSSYFGDPDVIGLSIDIDTYNLHEDPEKYPDLIEYISNPSFPIREEYENLKNYYKYLQSLSNMDTDFEGLFED